MKWHNKGHEYDAVYQRMEEITSYYLFGAGDYGNQFFHVIRDEIPLAGYLDNSKEKLGTDYNGLTVYSPEKDTLVGAGSHYCNRFADPEN